MTVARKQTLSERTNFDIGQTDPFLSVGFLGGALRQTDLVGSFCVDARVTATTKQRTHRGL